MVRLRSVFSRKAPGAAPHAPVANLPPDAPLPAIAAAAASSPDAAQYRLGDWPAELHPELEQFLDYWLSKHSPDGRLPGRAAIDPSVIPTLLPGIALIDVERPEAGLRFKFRLLGTHHSYVFQRNMAGRYVDEMVELGDIAATIEAYTRVVQQKLPHYWRRTVLSAATHEEFSYERVVVPLAQDGETVNMLFGYWLFRDASDSWHWWRDPTT